MIVWKPHYLTRALLALMAGAFIFTILHPGNRGPQPGEPAPGFELMALDGRKMQLSEHQGKLVVLNFWATWCPPCVEEMPSLNRLQDRFGPKGLVVLAVSVDHDEEALRRFVAAHSLRMTILRDPERRISTLYQTYKFPETYVLDRRGRLAQKMVGPEDWSSPRLITLFEQMTGGT